MKKKARDNKQVSKHPKKRASAGKSKPFPIVAIGASAGGLEAVSALLEALPYDTGMAYVYIQHLDPTRESMLSDILARYTKMKVLEAKEHLKIKRDHFYVIPPNKNMTIIDGVLTLKPRESRPSIHMPIDKFFMSLAEKQKDGAIGIVLSGNASDGTLGLKAIKAAGGLTFAQDDSAKFTSMPKSAAAEGVVDLVLPVAKIAVELARISENKDFIKKVFSTEEIDEEFDETELNTIIELLRKSTGVDFSHYKISTIKRRITRRMLLQKIETLKDYLKSLKQHTSEIQMLYNDLLINVTAFFRDPDSLEYLKKTTIPKIFKAKKINEPIRIWIPACSTGEEAYSLAIILNEILEDNISNFSIQIFATDLSDTAIAKARMGLYSKADVDGVSLKRLQRFFVKTDSSYRIVKSIRDLCVFAPHNIFRDPPFSRLDLISCCNLMIYLEPTLQKKILHTFHYSLNPDGYLVLGKSETNSTASELFSQIEKKYKVYCKKKQSANKAKFDLKFPVPEKEQSVKQKKSFLHKPLTQKGNNLEKVFDDMLLQKYVPASVVVNEELEILQFRGSTSLYLEPAPGKASLNLVKMARPGLSFELRNAIHKSNKSSQVVKKSEIEIKFKGHIHVISIEVTPFNVPGEEKLFLVVFEETSFRTSSEVKPSAARDKIVKQLEQEIDVLKDDMRSMLEEQEAHVEELQSANEEIVSSNEELQSINEELETSKEEVESTNEELTTINNELQVRNEQLSESIEYAEAVFDTIREAVLVLDKNFRIKSANKAFYRVFGVTEQETEGVLIYELGNRQWDIHKLRQLLEEIIPRNSFFSGFEVEHTFQKIGHKVMVLNAKAIMQKNSDRQLILLAMEDITEHRQAEKLLSERESWFRNMANQAPVMIWVAGNDKRKNFFNDTWLQFTGRNLADEQGFAWQNQIHVDDVGQYLKCFNKQFDKRVPFTCEYRLMRADGVYRWVLEIGKPTFSEDGSFSGYIGSCTEIHDKKILHEELEYNVNQRTQDLQKTNLELQRSNNELQQFAYVASHDLQEPLRKILTYADRLQRGQNTLTPYALSFVGKIAESSKRMRKLIDELLNFSRTSRQDQKYEKTDLQQLLKTVISDFELIIEDKKATINYEVLPVIEAIPVQMEQLLHNMISNALKFARNDSPSIITITTKTPDGKTLATYGLDGKRHYVEIIFSDNGIGFDPEYAEQIFDIFQRLNYKQDYPGTGIGLALVRKIVNNHRGKIYAKGIENVGAEFHVIMPTLQPQ